MDIDILVPCAGSAEFFPEVLSSIASQTLQPKKIYFVENACPHDEYKKALSISPIENSEVVRFEDRYLAVRNWQRCLGIGNSRWQAFLHDDDIWKPDYLEKVALCIKKNPDADIILIGHRYYKNGTEPFEETVVTLKEASLRKVTGIPEPLLSFFLSTSNAGHMSSMVFRRGSMGFSPFSQWMPDQIFLASYIANGKIAIIPEILVGIRMSERQATEDFKGKGLNSTETLNTIKLALSCWINNFGLKPDDLDKNSSLLNDKYLFRLLQACNSWPIKLEAYRFGSQILKLPRIRKMLKTSQDEKIRLLSKLPSIAWVSLAIIADIIYLLRDLKSSRKN